MITPEEREIILAACSVVDANDRSERVDRMNRLHDAVHTWRDGETTTGPPDGLLPALLDGLRDAGWVLMSPERADELRRVIGVVLNSYLITQTIPTPDP